MGYSSNQSLVHLSVHGEAVHPEKKKNLNQSSSMTGQEPCGGHLDMVAGGESGGVKEEQGTEGKEWYGTEKDRVDIVGWDVVGAVDEGYDDDGR